MPLTPDGAPALESGLSMAMAAAGTRGELVADGAGGFELASKGRCAVGRHVDRRRGRPGRPVEGAEAAVIRFRTGLDGLGVLDRESLSFDLGVDAQRRESPMLAREDMGFIGGAKLAW